MIRTVLGDIAPEALGHTQCHEHLYIRKGRSCEISPALLMEDEEKTCRELIDYGAGGGKTVVDAQPPFCGRMAKALIKASQFTAINIIAVTGFHKLQFYDETAPVFTDSAEALKELFIKEIEEGMISEDGEILPAKAGLVKAAADWDPRYALRYETLFSAVAEASGSTGTSILIHTEQGYDPWKLLQFFVAKGIPPKKLIFCHMDRTVQEQEIHRRILEAGAFLCYDSIHRLKYISEENELMLIQDMLECGFEDQLLLSLDTTNQRLRAYGADMGLDYICKTFIPLLKQRGIKEEAIEKMTGGNAQRALGKTYW